MLLIFTENYLVHNYLRISIISYWHGARIWWYSLEYC